MIYINAYSLINALGGDKRTICNHLIKNESGLKHYNENWLQDKCALYLGKITVDLPLIPVSMQAHNSRNNQLLLHCANEIQDEINELKERFESSRIAIILGTSTSGIFEGEIALEESLSGCQSSRFQYQQQCFSDPSDFLSQHLNITGPCFTISTACSSSARAFISAARLLEADLIDAAIVGGADTLCKLSTNGFNSLGALTTDICHPFAEAREGINIGEAAGLMVLSKKEAPLSLLGWGASSDAWHISAPHPEGLGAISCMQEALKKANITPNNIGYINLHGTGTLLNDSAESKAIEYIFQKKVPVSSTKHLTGHTLGAAGITEISLAALILEYNLPLPAQIFTEKYPIGSDISNIRFAVQNEQITKPCILSNSFAFGGNNASLIIGFNYDA